VTTLETDDCICTLSQQIDKFTFTFIAPLGADDYDVFTHS
jgi:hypothetical protein